MVSLIVENFILFYFFSNRERCIYDAKRSGSRALLFLFYILEFRLFNIYEYIYKENAVLLEHLHAYIYIAIILISRMIEIRKYISFYINSALLKN